jgi:hypothetical protein
VPAADRWAPWIEPTIAFPGALAVATTAPAQIFTAPVSFTPHIATRLLVGLYVDLQETTLGTDSVIVRVQLNGVTATNVNLTVPNLAVRFGASRWQSFDLLALTTYTVTAQAFLATATGTVWTIQGASVNLVGMPNLTPP